MFSSHWDMLSKMITENYATPEYDRSVMLMGVYLHKPIASIRHDLKNVGMTYDKIIVYQLEPLIEGHWWTIEHIVKNIRGADEIWDYDLQNIEILRKHGIDAKFRPPTYTESLKKIKTVDDPDIDILFYGSYTEHRCKLIQDLHNRVYIPQESEYDKINFVWLHNIADKKLDDYMARSKIILNMNSKSGDSRQQQTRIFYPLINDKCILSEKSSINYFGDSIHEYKTPQEFNDKMIALLANDAWKNRNHNFGRYYSNFRNRNKIAIFYHLYQTGDWKNIFEQQIFKTQQSWLFDSADYIHIGVNGSEPLPFTFDKVNRVQYNKNTELEADTIKALYDFCLANPDYKVMYIHSKGVTWNDADETKSNIVAWRNYMEHFTVNNWRKCCALLDSHDCVGTEWEEEAHIGDTKEVLPHYAGNFWWANASYIKKLPIDDLFIKNEWTRWKAEFWIGSANPIHYNFYTSGKNKYVQRIDESEYLGLELV